MKNIKYSLFAIFTALLVLLAGSSVQAQHKYLEQHKSIAQKLSKEYGIPTAIILSIAFVETGGGTSKLCKEYNNHFGIVGPNHKGNSKYRYFESTEESFRGFCKMIAKKKYYATLKGESNNQKWVKAIAAAGYSTHPAEWTKRINLIINKYNL